MISYRFVPISSQKGLLFFETPGIRNLRRSINPDTNVAKLWALLKAKLNISSL